MASVLSDIVAACNHGAALVYHEIVAVEDDVTAWEANHPDVGPLLKLGTDYAEKFFAASGVPVPSIISAGTGILSVLKAMAANDTDVISGGTGTEEPTAEATQGGHASAAGAGNAGGGGAGAAVPQAGGTTAEGASGGGAPADPPAP